ncbi:MAG: LysM peptidoglycan-binding domain-containing protein [Desulfobulbus sp.]|nr:LysM peptidoglycan-binding domain-containing protein [Desulfobulbus sp.]
MNNTTVTTVENLLAAGRIVEAKALLIPKEPSQNSEVLRKYSVEIERRLARAKALVTQAAALEREGKINEAKALYESVLPVAADFPGIAEHLSRMDEVVQLTRAVQRRSERLRHSRPAGAGMAAPKKSRIIWAVLGTGVVTAALLLAVTMLWAPQPAPEKKRIKATPAPIVVPSPAFTPPVTVAPSTPPTPSTPPMPDRPMVPVESQPPVVAAKQAESHPPPPAPDRTPAHDPLPPPQEPPSSAPDVPHPLLAPEPEPPALAVSQAPAAAPTGNQAAKLFYTVRRADSLSSIARNELCNDTAWQQIYQLNRDRITAPDLLLPGMVLRLTGLENRCPPAHQPASQKGSPAPAKSGREKRLNH